MKHQYDVNYKALWNAWKRAFVLNRDNLVFIAQIIRHASGPSLKRSYQKLLETKNGGDIAYRHEEISTYFPSLQNRPEGSVGKECFNMFGNQEKLLILTRRRSNDKWIEAKHPYSWMARRYRDTHDSWHILTGYKPTSLGEMCLATFSFAQTKSLAWLAIAVGSFLKFKINKRNIMAVYEAYILGKKSEFLMAEDYDKLFSENLHEARIRLNIAPLRYYDDRTPNLLKL